MRRDRHSRISRLPPQPGSSMSARWLRCRPAPAWAPTPPPKPAYTASPRRSLAGRWWGVQALPLPPAFGAGVGADINKERITAADLAVVQHHDAGVAAIDAVEHPDMNGVKTITDAAFSGRNDRRRRLFADGCHH